MNTDSDSSGFSLTDPADERGRRIRAGLYLRLSDDPQGTRLAVARQEKELREMCAETGWDVADIYIDNDTSAFSGKPRKEYERLMADVEAGALDAIGAWHNDRLHRRSKELIHFIEVVNARGTLVAVRKGGLYDLTTPAGRLSAKIVGDVAEYESDHKSERLRSKHRQVAESGIAWASRRPYGYTSGRREAIVREEADVIKEAATRVLGGDSLRQVCRDLNERGLYGATGKPWTGTTLRSMLLSAGLSGRRETYLDAERKRRKLSQIIGPGRWKPIITIEQSDRLRRLLTDPTRRQNGRMSEFLLTGKKGVARCGTCGAAMVSRPRHDKGQTVDTMLCQSIAHDYQRGHVRVVTQPVEDIVSEAVLRAVDGGALRDLMKSPEDTAAMAELAAVEDKLKMLTRDWMTDAISRSEYEEGRHIANARKRELERTLERSRRSLGLAGLPDGPLRAAWNARNPDGTPVMPLYKRRAVVNALVEAVIIAPAVRNGGRLGGQRGSEFDPSRITIRWRS